MATPHHSKLPRLEPEWYRGHSAVFWTHPIANRATGWLNATLHARFRELLLHTCARHQLACPAYVLMPDHWHLIWLGLAADSDQLQATKFLREHIAPALAPFHLQEQAHDHVLREDERKRAALQATCHYIFENPVRAHQAATQNEWPYKGAMIAGYPALDPSDNDYWDRFWKIHAKLTTPAP